MGVVVWAMEEFEADDALAAAAQLAAQSKDVEQVIICTPDKDLSQCVRGQRVVQLDRRKRELRDEAGVVARFGVGPASIPDYLALVGDSADGFPGVPGWGEKASGAVLGRYAHLDRIPASHTRWEVPVRGAAHTVGQKLLIHLVLRDYRPNMESGIRPPVDSSSSLLVPAM